MIQKKSLRKKFSRLTRKRVRQLKHNFRDIAKTADSESVHDFRKATRHLQSIVDIFGNHRHPDGVKKLHRQLQGLRHAAGEWRDADVMLQELRRRRVRPASARRGWRTLASKIEKRRERTSRDFLHSQNPRQLKRVGSRAKSLFKKEFSAGSVSSDLAESIMDRWKKWNRAIDKFTANRTVANLHAVRTKTKSLRYALELSIELFPDPRLQRASNWLKEVQHRVGEWHDELMLGERALAAFAKTPRAPGVREAIRQIKEREIALAEAAGNHVLSMRKSPEYRSLRRRLSSSLFAMSARRGSAVATEKLAGPAE
jgi:CHAD domain-containing protein